MSTPPLPPELVSLVAGPVWPCGGSRVVEWADHQQVCRACGEVPF
jgi:hypothetical protein